MTEAQAGGLEDGPRRSEPTLTAVAVNALLERIDNPTYRRIIETRAVNGGWGGARGAGLRNTRQSDAVAIAAIEAVWDLFRLWAAECDDAAPATEYQPDKRTYVPRPPAP
jgi:hypothetical protein